MSDACLHELFEDQVDRHPADPALLCGEQRLSYLEVDQRANRLAHHLQSLGARPGVVVALQLERSEQAIVAMLAILKTGAGYVPIDPATPSERVGYILADAQASLILTESALAHPASPHTGPGRIVLDAADVREAVGRQPATRLSRGETGGSPGDTCYIIYEYHQQNH